MQKMSAIADGLKKMLECVFEDVTVMETVRLAAVVRFDRLHYVFFEFSSVRHFHSFGRCFYPKK